MRTALITGAALLFAAPLAAQATGAIEGEVRNAFTGRPVAGARVLLDNGRRGAVTDSAGVYRIRVVRVGLHTVRTTAIGYRPARRDGVRVQAGETTVVDIALRPVAREVDSLVAVATPDPVLDPLATATEQTITAADLRDLPVSSLEEAVALSAGAVGESYRGGRLGQESFIIDGLGVKNQLDATTGSLGIRLPPDVLSEASLTTNGFSARYGQAISGLINVVTKEGGDELAGRLAYETSRPASPSLGDYGLDRLVAELDGPLFGGITFLAAVDARALLDAEPVNAPAPANPLDPRHGRPWLLPHNSGSQLDAVGKLTIPLSDRQTLRLFGLRSVEQQLLYDPAYKYDVEFAPARRTTGHLLSAHLQHTSSPEAGTPLVLDLRVGHFGREFLRGTLTEPPDSRWGPFMGGRFEFVGEEIAKRQDAVAAQAALPGFVRPNFSEDTPWGVPGFFLGAGSEGEIAWTRFRETRVQFDATIGGGPDLDLSFGGDYAAQRVQTFHRLDGYAPVSIDEPSDSILPATASDFSPIIGAVYAEALTRLSDLGFTVGLRYDYFDPRAALGENVGGARGSFNPRFGVSTVLAGATVVASYGRFTQPPDLQYLVDAAFDDTTRTGRFRHGNPNLGFESSWQFELNLRLRVQDHLSVRAGVYQKRMEGLVGTFPLGVDPDSSIFGNIDYGSVRGAELRLNRELHDGWGLRLRYTLQHAMATSTNAFLRHRLPRIDPLSGDTLFPARVEFPLDYDRRHGLTAIFQTRLSDRAGPAIGDLRPLAGLESAVIFRYTSGLPFSRTTADGDSLIGVPNEARLPAQRSIDLLLRRPFNVGGLSGSVYLDVRNLLNRRNIVAVRRNTGTPVEEEARIIELARDAYEANPEPIPYESPRYRDYADLNNDGLIAGEAELFPLYEQAARDFVQPLFAYGPPRMVRVGMEWVF